MNGAALPAGHGFPLRLIAPGWYGIANVKWLKRIEVLDAAGQQTELYPFNEPASLPIQPVVTNAGDHLRITLAFPGRTIRLRIRVTGLDAMCRMIHNGLGVGVMPLRAFELMHGVGELECVGLSDEWARRSIDLVARDFSTLPVTGRLLVQHLTASAEPPEAAAIE